MVKASLAEIARRAEVSKTTVSMVLNGKGDQHKINQATQERILSIASDLNYRPNFTAQSLSRGKTMTIGLIVPNIADSYYSSIAYHMEQLLAETDYQLLLGSSQESPELEAKLLRTFVDRQVDAMLVATTERQQELLETIDRSGIPVVLFDRHYHSSPLDYVIVNNHLGVKLLVDHLVQGGHQHIGYVGLNLDLEAIRERQRGFKESSTEHRVGDSGSLRIVEYASYAKGCEQAVKELVASGADAIVFETHYLALHGIRILTQEGIAYPDKVSVVSYGDHEVFSIFGPQITAVDQPSEHIAQKCIKQVLARLDNEVKKESQQIVIDPLLIVRNT